MDEKTPVGHAQRISLSIRDATIEDLPQLIAQCAQIQQFHIEARPDQFREPALADLRDFIADKLRGDAMILVAEMQGAVVGHLMAEVVTSPPNLFRDSMSWLYVDQIGVSQSARRRGAVAELSVCAGRTAGAFRCAPGLLGLQW